MEQKKIGDFEYNVSAKLGQGAYGTVFRGRRISESSDGMDVSVAVKRVPSGMLKDVEVDTAVKAHGPYIVNFLGLVEDKSEDMTYVVMELCDMDLGEFLAKYGKLTPENLETLVKCMAEGYMSLYAAGIVHRDVKPQNILLKFKPQMIVGDDDDLKKQQPRIEVAKFADFGCSRDTNTENGRVLQNLVGTLLYMAPEVGACIVESHQYTCEIDMWSMGVVLYECITGDVPFNEQQLCKLFLRAMHDSYTGYHAPMPDNTSDKFKYLIGKLLALDPSARLKPQQFHDIICGDKADSVLNSAVNNNNTNDYDDDKENVGKCKDKLISKSKSSSIKRTASALFSRILFYNMK